MSAALDMPAASDRRKCCIPVCDMPALCDSQWCGPHYAQHGLGVPVLYRNPAPPELPAATPLCARCRAPKDCAGPFCMACRKVIADAVATNPTPPWCAECDGTCEGHAGGRCPGCNGNGTSR